MNFTTSQANSKLALLDLLINCKLNSTQYLTYESILKEMTNLIDRLCLQTEGYALVGIENGCNNDILLIAINKTDSYSLYTWSRTEKIEHPLSFKLYQENYKDNIQELIMQSSKDTPLSREETISIMLTQTLTGYTLNKNKIKEYISFSKSAIEEQDVPENKKEFEEEIKEIREYIIKANKKEQKEIVSDIKDFADTLECDKLLLEIKTGGLITDEILLGKITDVRPLGNQRHYKIEIISSNKTQNTYSAVVNTTYPGKYGAYTISKLGDIYIVDAGRSYYATSKFETSRLESIPYEYIDMGRYLVIVKRKSNDWKIIISGDPKVDPNYKETLKETTLRYCKYTANQDLSLDGTKIVDDKTSYNFYDFENKIKSELTPEEIKTKGNRVLLQALKKMVNEYTYVIKKKKSIGTDVFITDKIKYNHTDGKISYGDFSIATDDELMKSRIFDKFDKYLTNFYRNEITEEAILNGLLANFFLELKERLTQVSGIGFSCNITINDKSKIEVKVVKTNKGSNLVYLNDQRFNRNEVLVVLKEITCYRDPKEAAKFISNVGKLGLSVYIGITTGYEVALMGETRIYRFKKEKGRSNYKLLLDDLELPIKGKLPISLLYDNFINNTPSNLSSKLQNAIFEGTQTSLDYIKYKMLISASYDTFKKKSKTFLDKKVNDLGGEFCRYHPDKKRDEIDGIMLTGMSGNKYIIAYDSKGSYVFLSPKKKEGTTNTWIDGKYICMVDQSNIKSNIGYDTVISKLMAIKNDSMIAGTIYNLSEEIEIEQDNDNDREEG